MSPMGWQEVAMCCFIKYSSHNVFSLVLYGIYLVMYVPCTIDSMWYLYERFSQRTKLVLFESIMVLYEISWNLKYIRAARLFCIITCHLLVLSGSHSALTDVLFSLEYMQITIIVLFFLLWHFNSKIGKKITCSGHMFILRLQYKRKV